MLSLLLDSLLVRSFCDRLSAEAKVSTLSFGLEWLSVVVGVVGGGVVSFPCSFSSSDDDDPYPSSNEEIVLILLLLLWLLLVGFNNVVVDAVGDDVMAVISSFSFIFVVGCRGNLRLRS